jgi:hypothetical protein
MIKISFGRYAPTLETVTMENGAIRNAFKSVIHEEKECDLTEAVISGNQWLVDHFGFVLIYHNDVLIKRLFNYKVFEKTFNDVSIMIELVNHINY